MDDQPIEAATDHACVLGTLTRRLAESRDLDRAALAAAALDALLRGGTLDRCCLPHYLALAPRSGAREVQVPVASDADVSTRVIVWPVGSGDAAHPHARGWTVFVPVVGQLVTVDEHADATAFGTLEPRRPVVLRSDDPVRHRLRNQATTPALTVHVSGES